MTAPRVSVCIPAYQQAAFLEETLASVWSQNYDDFEVVVVDDGSTDGTADVLAAQRDARLRVARHPRNRGQRRTVGEAVGQARADLVKFLDADDLLHPDCVGKMVSALDAHPSASFVFCRRDVLAEAPEDPRVRAWLETFGTLHDRLAPLDEVNDGSALLRRYLDVGMGGNFVAEPAGVMARRAALLNVGGLPLRVHQNTDMDLWMRLLARGDAAFLDEALYTYRLAMEGMTGASAADQRHWLDTLWIAEGLLAMEDFPQRQALRRARRRRTARALEHAALELAGRKRTAPSRVTDLLRYARYRLVRRAGRRPVLHEDFERRLPLSGSDRARAPEEDDRRGPAAPPDPPAGS
jgi:glycosyltransferase involved in cell wall biosynthesis